MEKCNNCGDELGKVYHKISCDARYINSDYEMKLFRLKKGFFGNIYRLICHKCFIAEKFMAKEAKKEQEERDKKFIEESIERGKIFRDETLKKMGLAPGLK